MGRATVVPRRFYKSMDQISAAVVLCQQFYEWVPSKVSKGERIPKLRVAHGNIRVGKLILPSDATQNDFINRRNQLLPPNFRFTIGPHPDAKYLSQPEPAGNARRAPVQAAPVAAPNKEC
jgi:hypothetical protein